MQYTVLNDFTAANGAEFKKDSVVSSEDTTIPAEEIASLIVAGNLDPIIDETKLEEVTVDQAWLDANPDAVAAGVKLGDTVKQEKIEEEPLPVVEEETEIVEEAPAKVLVYRGQEVLTDGIRVVNGFEYHHLRLADGTMTDVTDEEYAAMIASAQ